MTITEYLNYEAPAGYRDELLEGEVLLSPSASWRHSKLCLRLADLLRAAIPGDTYEVLLDTTVLIEPDAAPRPDVYVIRRDRLPSDTPFPQGSPELTIEVLSPGNTTAEIETKKRLYLTNGSHAFWLVDHQAFSVTVFTLDAVHIYGREHMLPLPLGISLATISVAALFS